MDIACQGGLIADIFDMGFLVQYRLIEISTALMRVEPNSMPRTVFPLSVASWVSFRFMFISQDLKSFLQLFFREETVFIPLHLYSHIADRKLLF